MTKLLSTSELAEIITKEYCKTSERTIRYCLEKGELKSTRFKPRGKYFINPADIPAFLLANQVPKENIIKIMQAITNAS
jgi:hypothetical protein